MVHDSNRLAGWLLLAAATAGVLVAGCKEQAPDPAAVPRTAALTLVSRLPGDPNSTKKLGVERFEHLDDFPVPRAGLGGQIVALGDWAIPAPIVETTGAKGEFLITVRFRFSGQEAGGTPVYRRGVASVRAWQERGKWKVGLMSLAPAGDVAPGEALRGWASSVGFGALALLFALWTFWAFMPDKIEGFWSALIALFMTGWWLVIFAVPLIGAAFVGTARGSYNAFGMSGAVAGILAMLVLVQIVFVIVRRLAGSKESKSAPAAPQQPRAPIPEALKRALLTELRDRIGDDKYYELLDKVGEDALAEFARDHLHEIR